MGNKDNNEKKNSIQDGMNFIEFKFFAIRRIWASNRNKRLCPYLFILFVVHNSYLLFDKEYSFQLFVE
ncbi:hypothetical protein BLA29_010717 [Euroglyphus maynei]|uniref:Uncharacterized protein n=1 Tax=Euroglyphus maynei TaxID=6958 RepID=A0A1Y3BP64_EURMA|nr:hypothetical protein BLA29_010717 [Euroglyphus maynei]